MQSITQPSTATFAQRVAHWSWLARTQAAREASAAITRALESAQKVGVAS